jgi:hypothetical protein
MVNTHTFLTCWPVVPSNWLLKTAIAVFLVGYFVSPATGQRCNQMVYEHKNQIDPKPIEVGLIRGATVYKDGSALGPICVGIFTESEHKLLVYGQSDEKGAFTLDTSRLPDGEYRFVGQVLGFCPANLIIRIRSRSHKKRTLLVHMYLSEIDICSYVDLAKR